MRISGCRTCGTASRRLLRCSADCGRAHGSAPGTPGYRARCCAPYTARPSGLPSWTTMPNAQELGNRFRSRPSPQPGDINGVIERALDEVCALFGASDARLLWEEAEEPWLVVGTRRGAAFTCREEKPDSRTSLAWDVPFTFDIIASSGEGRVYVDAPPPDEAAQL